MHFDNGIDATIHRPEDLLASSIVRNGSAARLVVDSGLQYDLVTSAGDPVLPNHGDGAFHPMSVEAVAAAIGAIRLTNADLQVEVFVLPYPRRSILDSSAREGMVFLSPGVREVSDYAVHFTITHEVGHVYQYRWMSDRDAPLWHDYATRRGIADTRTYAAAGVHKNRPHEIFAEDFRYLFGGTRANYSGSIENEDLALPGDVEGLEAFVRGLCEMRATGVVARLTAAPNPFNPSTEIRVDFEAAPALPATVRVFDAQGREVRHLYAQTPGSRLLRLAWDGRAETGTPVASGVYFARLDYANRTFSAKMLLVR